MLFNTASLKDFFKRLPKVELHRHLEGSLRVDTLLELARTHGVTLPINPSLRNLVQVQSNDPLTFSSFLSKFQTLRLFYLSPEVIQRVTYETVADAAADSVRYMELRFTPVALSRQRNFRLGDVMDWVCESAARASQECGITTRLIASVNRHESLELAEEVATLAVERIPKGIVGLDMAGNEAEFSALPFASIFRRARAAGLSITIHAGEWSGAANVRQAIGLLSADRIAHGVRVLEDPAVTAMACERGIPFEVCVTSNYQTGVIPALSDHPIMRMLVAGLNVTINTDDPSISQITLSDEYRVVCRDLGLHRQQLMERILAAARASFLPEVERQALTDGLKNELEQVSWIIT